MGGVRQALGKMKTTLKNKYSEGSRRTSAKKEEDKEKV